MTPALTRRLYISAWLLLGTVALGYFYYLFNSVLNPPDIQASAPPAAQYRKSAPVKAAPTGMSADTSVSQAIAHLRVEINNLKGALKVVSRENAALKAQFKALEDAFGPITASIPKGTAKPRPRDMKTKAKMGSASAPMIEVTMRPMPSDGFAEISVEQAPLPIAGPRAPTRTLFAIQLVEKLKPEKTGARWMELKKRHAGILGHLQPRTIALPSKGPRKKAVTLIAGPFNNAASAALACARLKAAGTKCKSTIYIGSPIAKVAKR